MTITKDVMNRYIKSMDNQQLRQLVDQPRDRISQLVITHLVSETQTARARQLSALRFGTSPSDSTFSEQSFVVDPSLSVDGEVYLSDALMDNVMQLLMQEKENPSCEASPSVPVPPEDDDIEVLPPPPPKTPPPVIDLDCDDAPPPEITKPQTKKEDASKPGSSQEKIILIPGIRPITASSILPSQAIAGPKPTTATSKSTGVTPKSTIGAPKSTGTAPGSTGTKHTSTDVAPKSSVSGPKSTAVAPTPMVIAQSTGVAQNSSVHVPKSTVAAPGPTVVLAHSTGVVQNSSNTAIQFKRTTPAPTVVASGTISVVPGPNMGARMPCEDAPESTVVSGSSVSTPKATAADSKSTTAVDVVEQVDMEVQSVVGNNQLEFMLSDYALEERQANERIAVIDKCVEEYLKERMELASRVQTLKQLQFDALRSALPVTSTADQRAPIRPSFAVAESQQVIFLLDILL